MTNLDVFITIATLDDVDILTPLFNAYRMFYEQESDLYNAKIFLTERLSRSEAVVFLALHGHEGLGFTLLYPSFSSVSMKRAWILNDLYVKEEARGQGIAQALLERAKQLGAETGAKELELATAITNLPAQKLYESLGWVRETDFYRYSLKV